MSSNRVDYLSHAVDQYAFTHMVRGGYRGECHVCGDWLDSQERNTAWRWLVTHMRGHRIEPTLRKATSS